MQIHEKIERVRVSAGLTQDEIAEKLGIKRTTYQYWEKKTPGTDKVRRVAEVLGLPIDYFFAEEGKSLAHDATLSVLIDEVAMLKAGVSGSSPVVERRKIEKAIEDVAGLIAKQEKA